MKVGALVRWKEHAEMVWAAEGVEGVERRIRDAVVAEDRLYARFLEDFLVGKGGAMNVIRFRELAVGEWFRFADSEREDCFYEKVGERSARFFGWRDDQLVMYPDDVVMRVR